MDSRMQRLHELVTSITKPLTPEQLSRHPEGKWCTAEILEHLYYTYTQTIKGMEFSLQAGQPRSSKLTFKQRVGIFLVLEVGHFPEGRIAPERTRPRAMPAQEVVEKIGPSIVELDEILTECEIRFGRRTIVRDHPILGPLNCTQWRKFHWIHGRHHVKQILKLQKPSP